MKSWKFTEIWQALSRAEKADFLKSLNRNKTGKDSVSYKLASYFHETRVDQWQKEQAWEALYPGEPFISNHFSKYLTGLTSKLESYIARIELSPTPFQEDLAFLDASLSRGLFRSFEMKLHQVQKKYIHQPIYGLSHLKSLIDFHRIMIAFHGRFQDRPAVIQSTKDYRDAVERYSLAEKTLANLALDRYEGIRLESMETDIKQLARIKGNSPYLGLLVLIYQASVGKYPTRKVWEDIKNQSQSIDSRNFSNAVRLLISHLMHQKNLGEIIPQALFQEIIYWALDEKILLTKGILTPQDFLLYVTFLADTRHIDAAMEESESLSQFLTPAHRASTLQYTEGLLAYRRQDYTALRKAWITMKPGSIHQQIHSELILCQAEFEEAIQTPSWPDVRVEIRNKLQRLRKQIDEHTIPRKDLRTAIRNKISLFLKFCEARSNKQKLAAQIDQTRPLNSRDWFQSQLPHLP